MSLKPYRVTGEYQIKLKEFDTEAPAGAKEKKADYQKKTGENLLKISELQDRFYSEGKEGLVIILQAMDAAGKDSTIKHVMGGINPQGVVVHSFKEPSDEELAHDFLWRAVTEMPERGKIAIFNRSYYEDVLIVRVRKLYQNYKMAERCLGDDIIRKRYRHIRNYEDFLYENSYRTVKIFLHLSKDEQKKRFLERIDKKIKNWKFSTSDLKERALWNEYQKAYEDAINETATKQSPWYVLPADNKWYTRYLVSEVLLDILKKIDPHYPEMPPEEQAQLARDREILTGE